MADDADIAAERMEREEALILSRRAAPGPEPVGVCLWCGEPLEMDKRWCDADCRDDWQRAENRNRHC